MGRHDVMAVRARDAIVAGDFDAARVAARALTVVEIPPRARAFDEKIAGMHTAAARVATSADDSLPREFGELARTCSDCHARLGGPTTVEIGAPPAATPGVPARMSRHVWAVDKLWIGLVFNSEAPWGAGAEVLADPSLSSGELVQNETAVVEVDALAAAVAHLGARAKVAYGPGVRARLYGDLLATCAQCHARLDVAGSREK